ncbi:hypothetical protein CEXT_724291 [Caerostris extrusa]|uniref:RNase H type-1 domain-containing protein n=1 Tax=Caerostris extrusa TaxID=172846 RepID=A0AAV4N949_CAEEX|nr:hypothetical protein CEXT_724291 [Caerostris extrusa]
MIRTPLKLRDKDYDVKFLWIPGHSGIPFNEEEDESAKNSSVQVNFEIPLGVNKYMKKVIDSSGDHKMNNKLCFIKPTITNLPDSNLSRFLNVKSTKLRIDFIFYISWTSPHCSNCNNVLSIKRILSKYVIF